MAEFIYQMYQARKAHGDKVILDDVTLSFYPGAKIGVVGPNGMGKSTLLKIMAGIEEVSNGDAKLTPGYTVGILQQEPPLDDDKTVIENVRMAFGDMIAKVDRFNKIGEEMCDPDCDMDALMAEMGKLQDEIDAADGWDIDSKLGQAMDALQLPDSDMPVNVLSGGERRRSNLPAPAFTIWANAAEDMQAIKKPPRMERFCPLYIERLGHRCRSDCRGSTATAHHCGAGMSPFDACARESFGILVPYGAILSLDRIAYVGTHRNGSSRRCNHPGHRRIRGRKRTAINTNRICAVFFGVQNGCLDVEAIAQQVAFIVNDKTH